MPYYRAEPSRPDKAKAIGGVIAVYALIGGLVLLAKGPDIQRMVEQTPTVLIDIRRPPPPPPQEQPGKTREEEGAAGKKAEPTPVVAPKPKIVIPTKPPVPAAPVPGAGSASTAGATNAGSGPGAGGSGSGRGGGGAGGGGGIGTEARLLGGNSSRLSSHLLRGFAANRGYGFLLLTISEAGRVSDCSVLQSTGSGEVDDALCDLMMRRSRWSPARDTLGRPISVKLRYTATWSKN